MANIKSQTAALEARLADKKSSLDDLSKLITYLEDSEKVTLDLITYLRTGRVQTTARIYGDIYHAAGVVGELRTMMLSGRDPKNYDGVAWLYDGV